ncbi:serine protease [Granulicella sp. S190]|uniref:S1 family peptidase n=1 Tax=Granulicella sp. S190 TaxID=1747226 RepID=UPI00131BC031|nr:serine protease [Granulicella sp. S190]
MHQKQYSDCPKLLQIIILLLVFCVAATAQQATDKVPPSPATTQPVPTTHIDPLSVQSLLVQIYSRGESLGSGTGFVVKKNEKAYLVTNWHVVSARRPDTGAAMDPQGRYPDEIQILQNVKGHLGTWTYKSEKLVNEKNEALWIEHPLGKAVDVVFVPLSNLSDVDLYPVNLELRKIPIRLAPAGNVSIIGFPFGHSQTAGLPIWKTGTIASDPDIDYDKSPQILVDCTGRPGMSGSPVYARRSGMYQDENTGVNMVSGQTDRFIGIYAGSIDQTSEIGRVWKASAIMTIYDALP